MSSTARPVPVPFALRPGEFYVSLGSATLQPGVPVTLSRTFGPDDNTTASSPAPPAALAPVTYRATPNDGTPDGARLALMNDLMRALPDGATTVLWLDDRPPEVQHHDPTTPADDLVTLSGDAPPTPALASVVANAIKKED